MKKTPDPFFIAMVPEQRRLDPIVVFDVDDKYVIRVPVVIPKKRYEIMKLVNVDFDNIPISILGFLNVPFFQAYGGNDVKFF